MGTGACQTSLQNMLCSARPRGISWCSSAEHWSLRVQHPGETSLAYTGHPKGCMRGVERGAVDSFTDSLSLVLASAKSRTWAAAGL